MYHEKTYAEQRRRRHRLLAALATTVLCVVLIWCAAVAARDLSREQGAAAVREAILRSALQCCAVEGSYPTSVAHLEEHYGLVINEADYQVTYDWLGDNILPSVVVRPR